MNQTSGQSIFNIDDDLSGLHRIVVRVGASAAWVATAVYFLIGLVTGEQSRFMEAIGPFIAGAGMTLQILLRREDGGIALMGSGLIVAVWFTAFGQVETVVPAAVSLVVISSLGMLFVDRARTWSAVVLAAGLALMPLLWSDIVASPIAVGLIMALSFVMTNFILTAIKTSVAAVNRRYQALFNDSPTAALEEDWSEAVDYLATEYTGKPERIAEFLRAYPAVVRRAVSKAKVLRVNDAAVDLLEITDRSHFIGYRDPGVVADHNLEAFVSALSSLYLGIPQWEQEVPEMSGDGKTRWLQARAVDSSTTKRGSSVLVALADVTYIRERSAAMDQLVRSKDDFIASVSHEIRTPLTAVIGLTTTLTEQSGLSDGERTELLKLAAEQAAEVGNIVEDLLVAARVDRSTLTIDSGSLDLVEELATTAEGIGVSVDLPTGRVPKVEADGRRVRQILRNLLTNAVRYGGPRRRSLVGCDDHMAWIEVRDNGQGISADDVERMFRPYETSAKASGSAVGLGLAVARQLAELMDGCLTYDRVSGETVFRLQLPLAEVEASALAFQPVRV